MYFFGGNDDLGVFIFIWGFWGSGNGWGVGIVYVLVILVGLLLFDLLFVDELIFIWGVCKICIGVKIFVIRLVEFSCRFWLL